jgi:hypothetical protein
MSARRFRKPLDGLPGRERGLGIGKFGKNEPRGVVDLGDGITGQVWSKSVHGGTWYACSDGKFRCVRDGQVVGTFPEITQEQAEAMALYGLR